ncbi:MAG: ChbG/HpnK family deacetylase [Magnetococcales bacterium]|nr:ChbG/HpnK family deacetylase [Magnetococcales bacterium]
MTDRQLIVNADDFGLSQSINQGILESHRRGIVTSTTVLANGRAFEQGMELLKSTPGLGVGVHLNVLRGPPLLDPAELPEITRQGRLYLSWKRLPVALFRRERLQIEREYRAQIERVLAQGIPVTHLDGEKHHQQFPPLFSLVLRLAESYRIPALRCAMETPTLQHGLTKMVKVSMLNLMIWSNLRRLPHGPIRHADHQTGIAMTGNMQPLHLEQTLRTLSPGIHELCCHPGRVDATHRLETRDFGSFYIDSTREAELAILTAPSIRQALQDADIRLISYAHLS